MPRKSLRIPLLLVSLLALGSGACVRRIVAGAAADALSGPGGGFASDDDPELIREAVPFGLKMIEGLVAANPEDPRLLLSAASGFTQYAWGFLAADAEALDEKDPAQAERLRARVRRMLDRAANYGLRGLEARHEGFKDAFAKDRAGALARLTAEDVPLLYWTGAAKAARLSISKNDMQVLAWMPDIEALMQRALELDPKFDDGALHEFFVTFDGGRPEAMGGSEKRAKEHMDRALALTEGKRLGPWVSWAENVAVAHQDRKTFDEMLDRVLAFDADSAPRYRLANLLTQRRARLLKARADDLFLE